MADGKVRFIPATISNKDFRGLGWRSTARSRPISTWLPRRFRRRTTAAAINALPPAVDPKPGAVDLMPAPGKSSIELKEVVSKEGGFTILDSLSAVCKKMLTDMNKTDKATKVASEKKITLGTVTGMEYRLEAGPGKGPGEISQALVRMYLVKNRLYVVAAGALEGLVRADAAGEFLDSFKLTDDKPK